MSTDPMLIMTFLVGTDMPYDTRFDASFIVCPDTHRPLFRMYDFSAGDELRSHNASSKKKSSPIKW